MIFSSCDRTNSTGGDKATSITLNPTSLTLIKGSDATIEVKFLPEGSAPEKVEWSSDNTEVATVTEGIVTAVGSGFALITATSENGLKARCEVDVTTDITSVVITPESIMIAPDGEFQLSAVTVPQHTDAVFKWSSSDEAIATVSQTGVVSGKSLGECYILAEIDGVKGLCEVTVSDELGISIAFEGVKGISIDSIIYTPTINDEHYAASILSKHDLDSLLDKGGEQAVFKQELDWYEYLAQMYEMTLTEALEQLLMMGRQSFSSSVFYRSLMWDTEYTAYAFGLTLDAEVTTQLFKNSVKTTSPTPSDNTFKIENISTESGYVNFHVTTANDDKYYITAQQKKFVDRFPNDEDLIKKLIDVTGSYPDYYHNGSKDHRLPVGEPETEYCIIIFGFDEGPTTAVTKEFFTSAPYGK